MQRWSEYRDRDAIRALWKLRFGDHDAFLDWFFSERFSPATSAVTEEDGRILTSIQSFPFPVKIRDKILPGAVIAGVSTLPEAEGRGHMGRTMRFYMNGIAARGAVVIPYRPEILAMYAGFGHYPVTDTVYLNMAPIENTPRVAEAVPLDFVCDESLLWDAYQRAAKRYSVIISRSLSDMRLKLHDYASDQGKAMGLPGKDGRLRAYCIYFDREERYIEEFFAEDAAAEAALFAAVCPTDGRDLTGKLPPDTSLQLPGLQLDRRPMNVMGVADVSALLAAVCGRADVRFEITDRTVAANNGVFTGCGIRSDAAPQIRLEAGRLGQFLCGYRSLAELAEAGQAEILDHAAAKELDAALPVQCCYAVDEY